MDEKYKALSDLVSVVSSVANAIVAAPKPLTVASLSAILPLLPQIENLAGELDQIVPEAKALDAAGFEQLASLIVADIMITDEKEKAVINASLKLVIDSFELVKAIKG